ncbi:hypothetical protein [Kitasatospora sp. NPDC101183]|uniref:hypothetical protein n=1 Tax=Kitasatospora sp. NPDC101183 TaxID=3364100 RepID=UPI00382167C6
MAHNDVVRRTAAVLPARRLTSRAPAAEPVSFVEVAQRALVRALPLRVLHRDAESGR